MLRIKVLAAAVLAGPLALAGCVSTPEDAPAWLVEREATLNDSSYPDLREVPRTTSANTNAAYWRNVQTQMLAAADAVKAHPRAQPGQPEDPAAFLEEARAALEATRLSHE